MKAYFEQLMDYNYWANGLVLKYAEQLPQDKFEQENAHSQLSVQGVLLHVLFAEALWLKRMQGDEFDFQAVKDSFNPEIYPTTKEIYARWFEEELRMRAFMGEMTEEQFSQTVAYTRSDGAAFEDTYADIFTHFVLHGMQHRAECAMLLTELGHSPGGLDYTLYLRP